jgi:molybdopterin adenylyltransferase
MRSIGAQSNPYSWLSRGIAGLKGTTLIVNLPGSLRGAKESLSFNPRELIKHGIEVAAGSQTHP